MGPESLNSMSSLGASDAKSKPTVRQSRSLSPLTRNTAARPASRPACRTRLSSTSPNVAASSSVRTASGRRPACTARSSLRRSASLICCSSARAASESRRAASMSRKRRLDILTRRVELLPRLLEVTSRGVGFFAGGVGSLSGGFGLASCGVGVAAGRFDLEPVLLDAAIVLFDQALMFVARSRSDDAAGLRSRAESRALLLGIASCRLAHLGDLTLSIGDCAQRHGAPRPWRSRQPQPRCESPPEPRGAARPGTSRALIRDGLESTRARDSPSHEVDRRARTRLRALYGVSCVRREVWRLFASRAQRKI